VIPPEIPRMQRGLAKKEAIPGVKNIIVVASGKGGVGKSTVSVNLASGLSKLGLQTGLLDADIFGPSIPRMMNLTTSAIHTEGRLLLPLTNYGVKCMSMGFLIPEASPIVWRGLMVMKALQQLIYQVKWSPLDILIIDMPPGTGDTQLTITQLLPIMGALIVTTPQDVAVADARKAIGMFNQVKVPIIGIINNQSHYQCPSCNHSTNIYKIGPNNAFQKLTNEMGIPLIGEIPIEADIASDCDFGRPIVISNPTSNSAQIFMKVAERVQRAL
jgi:ATP-binding protein involved in chromosome partitioning